MRPGGFASRCSARLPTTRTSFESRSTSSSAGRSSRASPAGSRPSSGRQPSLEELADATGLPVQHVQEALGAAEASVSLSQSVGGDEEGELGDLFADRQAADPVDEADETLQKEGIRRALEALPARERRVLELRFGFEGEQWTLDAIGQELNVTRERVRQLETQGLARMQRTLAA
jgi:RNA polymerase primary sigma factor